MNRSARLELLKRIAQAAATTPAPPVKAPPDPSTLASELIPTLRVGYNGIQVTKIDSMVHRLSLTINQLTNGKWNFQKLKNMSFQFDPSSLPDQNTKNLMLFFQKVYKTLLNGGNAFNNPVPAAQIAANASQLIQSTELSQMSSVSPSGPTAQLMPGNNDLVQTIKNTLQEIQNSAIV